MQWTNAFSLEQVGEHIASLRKQQGLTQADFAEAMGVSHATLSALENGRSVSTKTLERAWQLLGQRIAIVPKSAIMTVSLSETDE